MLPAMLADHLRRFPGSQFTPDALYWLGRLAEEADNPRWRARTTESCRRATRRIILQTLPRRATAHLARRIADPDVLATIPPFRPALPLGDTIPAAAANRQARADALRSIASILRRELELRAAYAATGEPRLLLEVAQEGDCCRPLRRRRS